MRDGPLDMRMDPTRGQSAAEWLQTAEEADSIAAAMTSASSLVRVIGAMRLRSTIARAIRLPKRRTAGYAHGSDARSVCGRMVADR
jgi:16S rRNA C1402 N4-methylase RsmH